MLFPRHPKAKIGDIWRVKITTSTARYCKITNISSENEFIGYYLDNKQNNETHYLGMLASHSGTPDDLTLIATESNDLNILDIYDVLAAILLGEQNDSC